MKTINLISALAIFFSLNSKAQPNGSNAPDHGNGNGYGLYHHFSEITTDDVITYLQGKGFQVITTPRTTDGGRTWTCYAIKKSDGHTYFVTVYTDGVNFLSYEELIVD